MIVDVPLHCRQIALPERLQDHLVGALRALEEPSDVKALVGSEDCPDTRTGRRDESHVASVGVSRLRRGWLRDRRSRASVRVGGLQDRLLLMSGALTEHTVEAQ